MGGAEVGEEFGEGAFVVGLAEEAGEGVGLAGAGGAAEGMVVAEVAAEEADGGGAGADGFEVDGEGAGAVEGAEGADAVTDAGEQDGELRARGELLAAFELGGGEEAHGDAGDRLGVRAQIQLNRSKWAAEEKCLTVEDLEGGGALGVELVGGETAQMPGVYRPGALDVAACVVGVVDAREGQQRPQRVRHVPRGLEELESLWSAPLPDYTLPWMTETASFAEQALAYILSAIVGIALIFATTFALRILFRPRQGQQATAGG